LSQHLQQQHLQQQLYNITCNDNAEMIGDGCFVGQNSYIVPTRTTFSTPRIVSYLRSCLVFDSNMLVGFGAATQTMSQAQNDCANLAWPSTLKQTNLTS